MLVLSRRLGQKIVIDSGITVIVASIGGNRVSLGIEAPRSVTIARQELLEASHGNGNGNGNQDRAES